MKQVLFSELARDDLAEIQDYFDSENREAGLQLLDELELACDRLVRSPKIGMKRDDLIEGHRVIVVRKKYLVFYKHSDQVTEIVRIIHGSRDFPQLFHE